MSWQFINDKVLENIERFIDLYNDPDIDPDLIQSLDTLGIIELLESILNAER